MRLRVQDSVYLDHAMLLAVADDRRTALTTAQRAAHTMVMVETHCSVPRLWSFCHRIVSISGYGSGERSRRTVRRRTLTR